MTFCSFPRVFSCFFMKTLVLAEVLVSVGFLLGFFEWILVGFLKLLFFWS